VLQNTCQTIALILVHSFVGCRFTMTANESVNLTVFLSVGNIAISFFYNALIMKVI
jgi:hypothetical protein